MAFSCHLLFVFCFDLAVRSHYITEIGVMKRKGCFNRADLFPIAVFTPQCECTFVRLHTQQTHTLGVGFGKQVAGSTKHYAKAAEAEKAGVTRGVNAHFHSSVFVFFCCCCYFLPSNSYSTTSIMLDLVVGKKRFRKRVRGKASVTWIGGTSNTFPSTSW